MNDLKTLYEVGAELDPPVAEPPDRLRGRVLSGMAGQPRRRPAVLPRFGRRFAGRRLVLVGGLAVALTAGLIAAQTLSVGDHAPAVNAEAAEVLQFAAVAAQKQPDLAARPGQFVFVETMTAYSTTAVSGGKSTTWIEPKLRQIWLSADGTGDGVLRERPQAGGTWEETPLPGCRDGRVIREHKGPETVSDKCEPMPAYFGDLPTDTDAMHDYLYKNSHGGNPRHVQAFITVGDLIRENYVRPQAMAALLNAAARIPGATVIRDVVDTAGRHGVAIAQTFHGERTELIFDPNSYAYLGERTVLTKNGDVTGGAARLRIAIVNRAGQLP
jgi:hypothetical protein